mgnify:CR=1 FL=1
MLFLQLAEPCLHYSPKMNKKIALKKFSKKLIGGIHIIRQFICTIAIEQHAKHLPQLYYPNQVERISDFPIIIELVMHRRKKEDQTMRVVL